MGFAGLSFGEKPFKIDGIFWDLGFGFVSVWDFCFNSFE